MSVLLASCCMLLLGCAAGDVGNQWFAPQTVTEADHWRRVERFQTEQLESLSDESRELRKWVLVQRAMARLQLKDAAKAIEDASAAIQLDPSLMAAYTVRADAYEMQGNTKLAEADRRLVDQILAAQELDFGADPLELFVFPQWRLNSAVLLGGLWGLVTIVYLAGSRKQRLQGGGTIRRWLWVSAAAAALAVAPYGVWAVSAGVLRLPGPEHTSALVATLASVLYVALALGPTVRLLHTKRQLQLVEDPDFLKRVKDLATKLGIAVPRVRLLRSTSEAMEAQAFAGGLPAPTLVVTDGVLHRLAPAERDGILAHEMAHVANGSLWWFAAIGPISCLAALVVSMISPVWYLFGFTLFIGLRRIVNRLAEPDCDRRAAEAIGYRQMASALAKIHAVNPLPDKGWLSALIFATATHPPREVRLAALLRRAPANDLPETTPSRARIRWHRGLSWAALLIWLAVLSLPVIARGRWPWDFAVAFPLLVVALGPMMLLHAGVRRYARRAQRRLGGQRPSSVGWIQIVVILVAAAIASAVAVLFFPSDYRWHESVVVPLFVVVAIVLLVFWPNKTVKLQRKVAAALRLHDFQQVVELERTAPKIFARDPILRHNFAIAAGVTGDRKRAIAELEELRRARPRFKLPSLALVDFYLVEGQTERALEITEQLASELKDDPAPDALAARALRRLGRLDQAQAAIHRVLAMEPEAGDAWAIAAGIALDRDDLPQARERLEKARKHAPGDATVLVAEAEIALAAEPLETARSAVHEALRAVDANPFALLDVETGLLRDRLAEREARDAPGAPPAEVERQAGHLPAQPSKGQNHDQ